MNFLKRIFGQNISGNSSRENSDYSKANESIKTHIEPSILNAAKLGLKFVDEYVTKGGTQWGAKVKLETIESWQEIKSQAPEVKAEICLWACSSGLKYNRHNNLQLLHHSNHKKYNMKLAEQKLGTTLLRSKLPYTQGQLAELVTGCAARRHLEYENPVVSVLGTSERILDGGSPDTKLKKSLQALLKKCHKDLRHSDTQTLRKIESRIEALLDPNTKNKTFVLPKGQWSIMARKDLEGLPTQNQEDWSALLAYAVTNNGARPSQKWLKNGEPFLESVGKDSFQTQLLEWMEKTKIDPARPDKAVDLLKGLVWLSAIIPTNDMILSIGRFAQNCYVKVPGIGARSVKLGNACCAALMHMPDNAAAIAELVRLRGKIKYPSVQKLIQKKLETLAEKKGTTVAELEDSSLPNFGFNAQGQHIKQLGDFTASIDIIGNRAVLNWADKMGKARKTVPKAVRTDFQAELTELKRLSKDVSSLLAGQIKALEQSYINDRTWEFSAWEAQYWNHPIRRRFTQSLIWVITDGAKTLTVLPTDLGLEDLSGKHHKPSKTSIVKLWHPLFSDTKTIVAWREKIEAQELEQVIKQAHREIYVLTDAERQTEVYSNRFAAHILRQHQFKALCDARGWSYTLQGMWDSWNIPQKRLPAFDIIVEYAVEMIEGEEQTGAGIPLYLSSDQVRFLSNGNTRMNMEDVPAIVFSETMRDVDLFVAVTSVASDPAWTDGGPDGRFGTYWQSYNFGNLGETAKTRKELIAKLIPKLAIADKLEVKDRYLKITGTRHNYNIHFGSGNIMIMPGNKYLCIVRAPNSSKMDKVYLPFAGDNLLSIILSKAHMLVNDDKITDKTILSQLK